MTQEVKLKRAQCNYQAENSRFLVSCDFSKQYNHYYRKRLERTRPFLEFNVRSKWGQTIPIYKLEDLASLSCFDYDDQDLETLSPNSRNTSPPSDAAKFATYQFKKRLRRFSDNPTSTQLPQTPTTSRSIRQPVESPILAVGISTTDNCLGESTLVNNLKKEKSISDCIVVIGTIFKRMKLQPDVVEELSRGNFHIKCERYLGTYTSVDDRLILEDTSESISLIGNIDPKTLVTGVVIALLGVPVDDGSRFLVWETCYAEPNRQILYDNPASQLIVERPLEPVKPLYLMVVSSLGFHQDMRNNANLIKALQNVIDFVWGAGQYEDDERCSRVTRILVVGDNLQECRFTAEDGINDLQDDDLAKRMKKSRQVKPYTGSVLAVKNMDDFFAQLSKTINVDVMPGASDPSSHLMPQQPFHPCMFPKACVFSTFNCITNPHHAIYDDNVEVLATSGQNVDIISKFSDLKDPVEIMKCHLMWGSSAPSAPDNLYSAPYEDEDPYVINFIPDIYIAGCQEFYKSEFYYYGSSDRSAIADCNQTMNESINEFEKTSQNVEARKFRTLLVTIPRFSENFSCVLINLKNLDSQLIKFI